MVSSKQLCEETANNYKEHIMEMAHKIRDEDGQNMLKWYLYDCYNSFRTLKVTVDIDDVRDIAGFSLMMAYGGPNVYLTVEGNDIMIEVYWGDEKKERIIDDGVETIVWDWIYEIWSSKTDN